MRSASLAMAILLTCTLGAWAEDPQHVDVQGVVTYQLNDEGRPEIRVGTALILPWRSPEGLFRQLVGLTDQWVQLSGNWRTSFGVESFSPQGFVYPQRVEGTYLLEEVDSGLVLRDSEGGVYDVLGGLRSSKPALPGSLPVEVQGWKFDRRLEEGHRWFYNSPRSRARARWRGHPDPISQPQRFRVWVKAWKPTESTTWLDPRTDEGHAAFESLLGSVRRWTMDAVWEPATQQVVFVSTDTGRYFQLRGQLPVEALPLFCGRTLVLEGRLLRDATPTLAGRIQVLQLVSPRRATLEGRLFAGYNASTKQLQLPTGERLVVAAPPDHSGLPDWRQASMPSLFEHLAAKRVRLDAWTFLHESGVIEEALVVRFHGIYKDGKAPVYVYGRHMGRLGVRELDDQGREVGGRFVDYDAVTFYPKFLQDEASSAPADGDEWHVESKGMRHALGSIDAGAGFGADEGFRE